MINPQLVFGGGMEYALTFLLVTAIVYAVFGFARQKSKGDFFLNEKTSGIVSAIIGLYAAIDTAVTAAIQQYMPLFVGLLALFFIIMLASKAAGNAKTDTGTLAVVLLALIVLVSALGTSTFERYIGLDAENVLWGAGILVVGALLWSQLNGQ